jgi:peptidoglycan/LPS O-acetylase OafA/YrhL
MSAAPSERLIVLDGLRGMASIAVLIAHMNLITGRLNQPHGYLVVDFFFILSGFVMAKAYGPRLRAGLGVRKLLLMRIVRLYPLAAAGVLLGAAASAFALRPEAGLLARATACGLVLSPCPGLDKAGYGLWPLDPPVWSLFFELAANLVFVLGLWRGGWAALIGVVGVCAALLVRAADLHDTLEVGFLQGQLWAGAARAGFAFTCGLCLFRLDLSGLPRFPFFAIAAVFVFVLMWPFKTDHGTTDLLMAVVLLPLLVAIAIRGTASAKVAEIAKWLCDLSYPLYALQWPLLIVAGEIADRLNLSYEARLCLAVVSGLGAIVFARLAFRWYDRPVRRWLSRSFGLKGA